MSFYAKKIKPHAEPSIIGDEDYNAESQRPDTRYKWGETQDKNTTVKGAGRTDPYKTSSC
jgi:hypothetical protein